MSKKQRVKGKGADIFFSEDQTDQTEQRERSVADLLPESTASRRPSTRQEDLVTKATFYFTQSQLDALEKTAFVLSQEHRIKTNKSEIMRIACEEITSDFMEKSTDSKLYERLAGS